MSDLSNALIALLRGLGGYMAQFAPVDLLAIFVFAMFWLWIWRKSANQQDTFSLVDALKDPYTNKAGGAALVYMGLAGLATWYIIREEVSGGKDTSNTLVTVLTIFILKAGADRAITAWGNRAPEKAAPLPDPPVGEDRAKGQEQDQDTPCKDQLSRLNLR